MENILLLEDLPEIRVWLRKLVLQVFPMAKIAEISGSLAFVFLMRT